MIQLFETRQFLYPKIGLKPMASPLVSLKVKITYENKIRKFTQEKKIIEPFEVVVRVHLDESSQFHLSGVLLIFVENSTDLIPVV